ncbi:unnamed protein product [Linum tenue]|uniref:MADS-box domain-containing protein n=1 Tax=Linum tenue TaxID=586396 RepID=A0AAV0NGM6_9ROSI|nr:unnamed protein product [Linum tenue]
MGAKRVKIELIKNERSRLLTYKKRKASLLKKINEFCILCDVKACLIIFSGNNGAKGGEELETWAPQSCTVEELIQQYRSSDKPSKCFTVTDYFTEKKKRVDVELSKVRKQIYKLKFPSWDKRLDNFSVDQLGVVLVQLDSKLKLADERITALTAAERAITGLVPPVPINFHNSAIQEGCPVTERELDQGYPSKSLICSDFNSHPLPSPSQWQSSAMANGYSDKLYSTNSSFFIPDRFNYFAPGVGEFSPYSPQLMQEFSPDKGMNFSLMQQYQQSNDVPVTMQSLPMPVRQEPVTNRGHHQGMLMPVNGGSQWVFDSAGMLGVNSDGGGGMEMGYVPSSGFQQMQHQFSSPAMAAAAGYYSHPMMFLNQLDENNIGAFEFDRGDHNL